MWKTWFKVYGDLKFYTNGIEYETKQQAIEKAREKFTFWTQAESWIVEPLGIDPNETN